MRCGLTASKKVGGAVERNRARRRLRAALAEIMPAGAALGHDYVLIARSATVRMPFALLKADMRRALQRLRLWRSVQSPSSSQQAQG
jgi:ribonuclease P protein component